MQIASLLSLYTHPVPELMPSVLTTRKLKGFRELASRLQTYTKAFCRSRKGEELTTVWMVKAKRVQRKRTITDFMIISALGYLVYAARRVIIKRLWL